MTREEERQKNIHHITTTSPAGPCAPAPGRAGEVPQCLRERGRTCKNARAPAPFSRILFHEDDGWYSARPTLTETRRVSRTEGWIKPLPSLRGWMGARCQVRVGSDPPHAPPDDVGSPSDPGSSLLSPLSVPRGVLLSSAWSDQVPSGEWPRSRSGGGGGGLGSQAEEGMMMMGWGESCSPRPVLN